MPKEISKCRICGNSRLETILNLGTQMLTGVFPKSSGEVLTAGPLELVKCVAGDPSQSCGLVQLRHSYDSGELYGDNYGYRSSLNNSMVRHLKRLVDKNLEFVSPKAGDLVIDIGSNDGTLLGMYPKNGCVLAGIDPTAGKFSKYYEEHICAIPEFFSADVVRERFGTQRAVIVTSIAMFYDLETPINFVQQVYDILDDEVIWVLEQSYLPRMLEVNAYDTICHEHILYYGLAQVKWMLDQVGFKILDIELNDVNGGSFSVTVGKRSSARPACTDRVDEILARERAMGLHTMEPFKKFKHNVHRHREELQQFVDSINRGKKKVFGYGASTKGNVILQYCDFSEDDIPCIAEVNEDKIGSFTPATNIPIVSEEEARSMRPDYFLVLPWHFRDNIVAREAARGHADTRLVFPLPNIETV
ncbi:MAG: class I SAM-dependent methyltransferase [Planctomycetota bacterium]